MFKSIDPEMLHVLFAAAGGLAGWFLRRPAAPTPPAPAPTPVPPATLPLIDDLQQLLALLAERRKRQAADEFARQITPERRQSP